MPRRERLSSEKDRLLVVPFSAYKTGLGVLFKISEELPRLFYVGALPHPGPKHASNN